MSAWEGSLYLVHDPIHPSILRQQPSLYTLELTQVGTERCTSAWEESIYLVVHDNIIIHSTMHSSPTALTMDHSFSTLEFHFAKKQDYATVSLILKL